MAADAPTGAGRQAEAFFGELESAVGNAVVGATGALRLLAVALLADGHALIEDVPGVGKTLLARAVARAIGLSFGRVQGTPDLLPGDVTGSSILEGNAFRFVPGPIFNQVVLVDEINRATPRTQAALLEAMQEHQASVDGVTRPLPEPFVVLATQNPIELEGTYPLPEAQLDRFLMRIPMGYPAREAEAAILEAQGERSATVDALAPVASAIDVADAAGLVGNVHVAPEVRDYVLDVVAASRRHPDLVLGASPRGSLSLQRAARALAASFGRNYVMPDDVKRVVPAVLEHRLMLAPDAQLRGVSAYDVVRAILASVPVPGASGG